MPTSKSKPIEVPAAEANRRFSELLRGVREEGKTFTITSHGRPVAQISAPEAEVDEHEAQRKKAWAEIQERMRTSKGVEVQPWTRDELYERGGQD